LPALLAVALSACAVGCSSHAPSAEVPPDVKFKPADFSKPTMIDNPYYPMAPGTRWVLEGTADRGIGLQPHQVIITVSDLTKVIDQVDTVVVWEQDLDQGKVQESELAFFAQDDAGNVWNLGEYPEEYSDSGQFKGAPSTWISGLRGARGGIHVPGRPVVGSPSFREGTAPEVDFLDGARIDGMNRQACAGIGCFPNALVIDEWSSKTSDGHQLKTYVPTVGPLRVDPRGGDEEESLILAKHQVLDAVALKGVAAEVVRLDNRGYDHGGDDYRKTPKVRSVTA
jgi:hypothetical protein